MRHCLFCVSVISEKTWIFKTVRFDLVQLVACKAEAFLRLHQIKDSDLCISSVPRLDHHHTQPPVKLFGITCDAYVLCVQAQVDMALGR